MQTAAVLQSTLVSREMTVPAQESGLCIELVSETGVASRDFGATVYSRSFAKIRAGLWRVPRLRRLSVKIRR